MPQMKPIYWSILFILTTLIILIFMVLNYFIFNYSNFPKHNKFTFKYSSYWKW